ncbi:glycosyl transferase [bacterium]|nr:glycosyl transferase [bacterium]
METNLAKSLIIGILGGLILPYILSSFPLRGRNFKGAQLPLLGFLFPMLGIALMMGELPTSLALLIFGILGLIDDIWGLKEVKGFKGHFHLLLRGKFSTGWLKALGGGIGGLVIASLLHHSFFPLILSAFIISASANFLNLLDLRPGRCLKTFLILSFFLLIFGGNVHPLVLGFAFGFLFHDLRERAMLGDSGSNSLGALLGLSFCHTPLFIQLLYAIFLLLILLLGEHISLSKLIEKNSILRFVDRLGRKPPF